MRRLQILYLTYWFPYPPDMGTNIRVYNLLRQLRPIADVTLLSFWIEERGRPDITALSDLCDDVQTIERRPFAPQRFDRIADWLAFFSPRPRSFVLEHSDDMATAVRETLAKKRYHLLIGSEYPTIPYLVGHDVPVLFELAQVTDRRERPPHVTTLLQRVRHQIGWWKFGRMIHNLTAQCTASTVASPLEQDRVRQAAARDHRVAVIPNGISIENVDVQSSHRHQLVYPGSVTYTANYDAVHFFTTDVLPLIRNEFPEVELVVTGKATALQQRNLNASGVRFTGYLEDVKPSIAASRMTVVPLLSGSGTRLKILQSLALGVPVVTTSKGAEGLAVCDGEHLLIADTAADFAAAVCRLLTDDVLHAQLATNGRRIVQERYDWEHIGSDFRRLVQETARA